METLYLHAFEKTQVYYKLVFFLQKESGIITNNLTHESWNRRTT
ncbi:MAG: hypothetical protein ACJAWA_000648 [Nonlabens sp.]|jgi:hypothetical protein